MKTYRMADPVRYAFAILPALFLIMARAGHAEVRLPKILGDDMVLQRGRPLPVWGGAGPGEEVTVRFAGQEKRAIADGEGRWQVHLDPLPASSAPREMTVTAGNTIRLKNILVGEVWLCSGQSNMEYAVDVPAAGGPPATQSDPALAEELKTTEFPAIRLFRVEKTIQPPDVVSSGWGECRGDARARFSAVGYFFARKIHRELGVPVGMIQSAWGGSRIEPWTPAEAYAGHPAFQKEAAQQPLQIDGATPGRNFDGMVRPLAPFALRGVLWYQGESNIVAGNDGMRYADKMQALIAGWRAVWRRDDLLFYSVQLAPFTYSKRRDKLAHTPQALPEFWEAQAAALRIPATGLVPTMDLVDDLSDIHPGKKRGVGERLAALALAKTYGRKNLTHAAPAFQKMEIVGSTAVIHFRDVGGGLASQDGRPLTEFEIADAEKRFVPATAVLRGNAVIVSSPKISRPAAVRFAWRETAQPNLVNREGWPAYPFRTDGPVWHASAAVIVDDSAFYEHMPKGTILTQGSMGQARAAATQPQEGALPPGSWLFNNSGLVMRSQAFVYARADIPEAGTYHLFVRSHGGPSSSFRVTVGDKQTAAVFGNEPLAWKRGGTFALKKGRVDVVLSRIVLGPAAGSTFDVLVLTRNADFREEDLRSRELPDEVALLKEYTIPRSSAVKFGDVDGDGKTDLFVLTGNYDGYLFDHAGRELWRYENEEQGSRARAEFEAPGLVWDLDRDGRAEVVHYRFTEGKEWLVVSDGRTGTIKHRTEWPTRPLPHEYNNFRLAVARLGGDYPDNILAFTDSGGTISITAYTKDLKQLWQHVENKKKDHLGHYVYAVDLDKDGIDEVVASPLVLDASGKMLWNRFDLFDDHHEHCDSFRFHDIDGDGQVEMLAPLSEVGVVAFRARDGALLWRHPAEHCQQLEVGNFLRGVPGPHIAVTARTYARVGEAGIAGQVHWFDARGNLLGKWPANPLNGNPDFVKGDWNGDGKEELFWYKFKMTDEGKGVLSFKQDVYHMFDFMGTGAEQVIARGGTSLLVYGNRHTPPKAGVKRDFNYWKKVANHTHY